MQLTLRAKLNYPVVNVEALLHRHETDPQEHDGGYLYRLHQSATPTNLLVPEDFAVTLLVNSVQNRTQAKLVIKAIHDAGSSLDLTSLPQKSLPQTTADERRRIAKVITTMSTWPQVKAAVATKILHKKRPALIPMLDNEAIFGAYHNPAWPEKPAKRDSVGDEARIADVLDWIHDDLTRRDNQKVWAILIAGHPQWSLVELFDMIWWEHYKEIGSRHLARRRP